MWELAKFLYSPPLFLGTKFYCYLIHNKSEISTTHMFSLKRIGLANYQKISDVVTEECDLSGTLLIPG